MDDFRLWDWVLASRHAGEEAERALLVAIRVDRPSDVRGRRAHLLVTHDPQASALQFEWAELAHATKPAEPSLTGSAVRERVRTAGDEFLAEYAQSVRNRLSAAAAVAAVAGGGGSGASRAGSAVAAIAFAPQRLAAPPFGALAASAGSLSTGHAQPRRHSL